LFIVKGIFETHGGIWAENNIDGKVQFLHLHLYTANQKYLGNAQIIIETLSLSMRCYA